jgi:Lon protease-like protein
MNKIIPIFPLITVIFPNSKFPLHIFEERYKKLINRILDEKSGFGVVPYVNNKVSEIGVFVEVKDITKRYSSGELDIIVTGTDRFFRKSLNIHEDGYYIAHVEKYTDVSSDVSQTLIDKLKLRFTDLLQKANYELDESFWRNLESTQIKSFKIAEKSGLTIIQQQDLLLLQDENKRLNYLINHFDALENRLEGELSQQEIILGNGYLNELN